MALIKCPECGREISDKAVACIHCGYPIATQKLSKENTTLSPKDVIGTPNLDDAFDSLQKLYQMGFIGVPTYNIWEIHDHEGVLMWHCECRVNGKEKFYQGDFYSKDYGKEVTAYQMILDVLGLEEEIEESAKDERTTNKPPVQKTTEQPPKQPPVQKSTEQAQEDSKPQKPLYKKWWFWLIVVWLCLGILGTIFGEDSPDETPEETTPQEVSLGSDKAHPYVITAEQLANEITRDISAAKAKYNGKWIKITGKISDTSDAGIFGYYIYGKKATSGYTGLKIICWCDDGPYSGSVLGDTKTFLGQVREITTFNATEIGDCEIVK